MRLFQKVKDGGPDSPVTAYVLIEIKSLFSIMLLHFPDGKQREAFHDHAFNAVTLYLKGDVDELTMTSAKAIKAPYLKYTPRSLMHKIIPYADTWALTVRGPWKATWHEWKDGRTITLTHGRKEV